MHAYTNKMTVRKFRLFSNAMTQHFIQKLLMSQKQVTSVTCVCYNETKNHYVTVTSSRLMLARNFTEK